MYMTHERAHPSLNENIFIIFPVFLLRAPILSLTRLLIRSLLCV